MSPDESLSGTLNLFLVELSGRCHCQKTQTIIPKFPRGIQKRYGTAPIFSRL